MSGLKAKNHILIVLVVGLAASLALYALPKAVIKNEKPAGQPTNSEKNEAKAPDEHMKLSEGQLAEIAKIRTENKGEQAQYEALSTYFASQNLFDSAAYFAEQLAVSQPSEASWLAAGDLYYQAFTLSLNPVNQEKLADLTRAAYQKALAINPKQLHAKTNTAMTYVSSSSPMQAIMMLRQVLDENPRYVPALMSMGALSMQSRQYDKALGRFEEVLGIDPGNMNAQLGKAYSLIELGKKEEAQAILQQVKALGVDEVLENEIDKTLKSLE
ncbi:tetratricopeptide repeat protein [Marinilongibacter aquaticus]|uniref:tetratricopeptide repeat protein n=1 Tax=Marinilongibacter aquaticus TaxID=2975157 RepID=UPI0021BD37E6|nr:tetratricopeptide repeat protein [Marinilongibacter aquaticus]UBM60522.1 tetratricopeptide repeat protein [Marinilongibacter aquaticus]